MKSRQPIETPACLCLRCEIEDSQRTASLYKPFRVCRATCVKYATVVPLCFFLILIFYVVTIAAFKVEVNQSASDLNRVIAGREIFWHIINILWMWMIGFYILEWTKYEEPKWEPMEPASETEHVSLDDYELAILEEPIYGRTTRNDDANHHLPPRGGAAPRKGKAGERALATISNEFSDPEETWKRETDEEDRKQRGARLASSATSSFATATTTTTTATTGSIANDDREKMQKEGSDV